MGCKIQNWLSQFQSLQRMPRTNQIPQSCLRENRHPQRQPLKGVLPIQIWVAVKAPPPVLRYPEILATWPPTSPRIRIRIWIYIYQRQRMPPVMPLRIIYLSALNLLPDSFSPLSRQRAGSVQSLSSFSRPPRTTSVKQWSQWLTIPCPMLSFNLNFRQTFPLIGKKTLLL
jgi:hypothetical protein